jgi:N6-adenosine-specific RNA methylase IME4
MGRKKLHKNNAAKQRAYRKAKERAAQPYYAKRAEARKALEDVAMQEQKRIEGVYDVIVIDPPWPVSFRARKARPQQVSLAYQTMSVEEIRALKLPLAETAHVWLWTTQRFLVEAISCLKAWGLTHSCTFIWLKRGGMQPIGLPQMDSEFVVYGHRGGALLLETTALGTYFAAPRAGHSAKPEEFYALVRRITAGRRLDMFARREIPGFESWGYEAPRET